MALHCGILSRVRAMLLEVKFVQLKYSYGGDLVEHKVLGSCVKVSTLGLF